MNIRMSSESYINKDKAVGMNIGGVTMVMKGEMYKDGQFEMNNSRICAEYFPETYDTRMQVHRTVFEKVDDDLEYDYGGCFGSDRRYLATNVGFSRFEVDMDMPLQEIYQRILRDNVCFPTPQAKRETWNNTLEAINRKKRHYIEASGEKSPLFRNIKFSAESYMHGKEMMGMNTDGMTKIMMGTFEKNYGDYTIENWIITNSIEPSEYFHFNGLMCPGLRSLTETEFQTDNKKYYEYTKRNKAGKYGGNQIIDPNSVKQAWSYRTYHPKGRMQLLKDNIYKTEGTLTNKDIEYATIYDWVKKQEDVDKAIAAGQNVKEWYVIKPGKMPLTLDELAEMMEKDGYEPCVSSTSETKSSMDFELEVDENGVCYLENEEELLEVGEALFEEWLKENE